MARRLLVTGFGPFLDVQENPSGALARALGADAELAGRVHGVELPVSFRRVPEVLDAELARLGPELLGVLCTGVHRGPEFRLERGAGPDLGSERPDVDGAHVQELDLPVRRLETTLDLEELREVLRAADGRAPWISDDAGGYVCERTYLHALLRAEARGVPALFLHVPPLEARPVAEQFPAVRALVLRLLERLDAPA